MDDETRAMIERKALKLVWSQHEPHRYRPKAIGEGPGWEVWDYLENRRVPLGELVEMVPDEVMQKIEN